MSYERWARSDKRNLQVIANCSSLTARFPRQNCVIYHFPRRFGQPTNFCPEKRKKPQRQRLSLLPFCRAWEANGAGLLGRVFVFVDALAHIVGLVVELALVFLGEMAVVFGHILLFVTLQPLFAVLQVRRLSGCKLAILY